MFSFWFNSTYPVQGPRGGFDVGGGVGPAYRPAAPGERRSRGGGQLQVDLTKRRFSFYGEANNVSRGILKVRSHLIYRGDRTRLYARTTVEDPTGPFEQCWWCAPATLSLFRTTK